MSQNSPGEGPEDGEALPTNSAEQPKKIAKPGDEPTADGLIRDRMSTGPNPLLYPGNGNLRIRHPEEDQTELVAFRQETLEPWSKSPARERRLEREVDSFVCEVFQPTEHDFSSFNCRFFRLEA